jgi:hypothetical protein
MGQGDMGQCDDISDEQVVYHTKQFFMFNKVIQILLDIENGNRQELLPPEKFMIDISTVVPDLYYGNPSEFTQTVFKSEKTVVGIENRQPIQSTKTVLDDYNDFVLKELPVLKGGARERAKEIREKLSDANEKILEYISSFCGNLGIGV